jgi:hypothetical protein
MINVTSGHISTKQFQWNELLYLLQKLTKESSHLCPYIFHSIKCMSVFFSVCKNLYLFPRNEAAESNFECSSGAQLSSFIAIPWNRERRCCVHPRSSETPHDLLFNALYHLQCQRFIKIILIHSIWHTVLLQKLVFFQLTKNSLFFMKSESPLPFPCPEPPIPRDLS